MAGNVSGNPVTDDIVRLIYPDVKDVTPQLRAKVAFQYMNAEGRDVNCKNFVYNLKQRYGNGISALCMLFNATGSSLTYVGYRDWHGHIYESPYPSVIQNGQWGGFLHVHPSAWASGSESAVVFRGKNSAGDSCDWMLAWGIPYVGNNHAYTEIREAKHYETDHWDYIKGLLEAKSTHTTDTWNGCYSAVTIGQGTSPEFVGIMSLDGVISERSAATLITLAADSATEDKEDKE
ncbi:hypothetical protein FNV43_RR08515 [Rhamnella rubrinervis]|uniref:23 kDa jasmonate-induced protein-like n=1 Tax=Rhamnella rubrinervis TaxID=2594499 RepID=A0A8K0H9D6_9ROSA|nr:hypothetical protein FNV43_RR08515 [Rhamnella rubrinervis]